MLSIVVFFSVLIFLLIVPIYLVNLHVTKLEKEVDEWNKENKGKNNGRMEIR